ncbi:MAG: porin family protein [Saprospiraceae bacterium]
MIFLKRLTLLFCLLFFVGTTAFSQNSFGFKLGTNFSKWSGDLDEALGSLDDEVKYASGLHAGMAFNIALNKTTFFQPEINYIQKGIKTIYDFGQSTEEQVVRFNYIEIPILVKISFPVSEKITVYGNAGPGIGYAINATVVYDDEEYKDGAIIFFDNDDLEFERTDLSLHIGGGIDLKAGVGRLAIDLRYIYGLSNLNSGDDDFRINNQGIGINLIYSVPFKLSESE